MTKPYRSVRNFSHPQGKPRLYKMTRRGIGETFWICKLTDSRGTVKGYGRGNTMEVAYALYTRDLAFRQRHKCR